MIRSLLIVLALSLPATAGIYVIDGDTIVVGREHIRIVGIDAPETRQARCDAELRLGLEAKARVLFLLQRACGPLAKADAGRCLTIQRQPAPDRYGRTLARIGVGGRDLGATLVAEGLARPYICPRGRCPARKPWCEVPAP
ncbi:thermonuclease family protein [Ancylobacter dichloromethanicus]|uniref:TNase-like domain-containing protein n=1 Tax=Ancylobacter dichloromethanicus TaxID=518825 RepID=A0A9W6N1B3_9HYPH|nr:thermonuclease family protein [Ancylobacter dichloromethanicus]MBS7556490.1 thermonuclease family protein [Ancylobacter dichloromethanicus]GLK74709.1 hypothetical protein GCM10017643_48280 [Ancylobacter dichloromethanicus]